MAPGIDQWAKDAIIAGVSFMIGMCFLVVVTGWQGTRSLWEEALIICGLKDDPEKVNMIVPKEEAPPPADEVDATPTKSGKTLGEYFKKYFREAQVLDQASTKALEEADALPPMQRFIVKNRKFISIWFPALVFHAVWWPVMIGGNYWDFFKSKYEMSITMIFGSMFAGCTSEGGAAVAFPVMTMVFDVSPKVARDFSFMIQAQGMVAASFAILFMKIKLEYHSILFCTIGGLIGMIFGLEEIAPLMDPPVKKIFFVCTWAAFASTLYWLNRDTHRITFPTIPNYCAWKTAVLVITGFVGGVFSSIAGSGIDICSFAVLTLLFRVTEKTATPTSVVLMGINTVIGFFYREFGMGGVTAMSWEYLLVCMPIVVFGAPLGSYIGSHMHRIALAWMVYLLDFVQLVGAYALVDFSNYPDLPYIGIGVIIGGNALFAGITYLGNMLLDKHIEREKAAEQAAEPQV